MSNHAFDLAEHKYPVRQVLKRLLENKLYLKAEKCNFHVQSVSFLGYIKGQGEVRMDPYKFSAVAELATPSVRKKLQGYLGFANFYDVGNRVVLAVRLALEECRNWL